jgi:hypothetical protein
LKPVQVTFDTKNGDPGKMAGKVGKRLEKNFRSHSVRISHRKHDFRDRREVGTHSITSQTSR